MSADAAGGAGPVLQSADGAAPPGPRPRAQPTEARATRQQDLRHVRPFPLRYTWNRIE